MCISSLLRLLAPIAPALASESWETLNEPIIGRYPTNETIDNAYDVPPIFDCPWPTALLTSEQADVLSARGGQTVAVQINGKLRFTVTVPRQLSPTTDESNEQDVIINRILETDEGRTWLREKNDWEKRRRVIVVKGGRLVNIVF